MKAKWKKQPNRRRKRNLFAGYEQVRGDNFFMYDKETDVTDGYDVNINRGGVFNRRESIYKRNREKRAKSKPNKMVIEKEGKEDNRSKYPWTSFDKDFVLSQNWGDIRNKKPKPVEACKGCHKIKYCDDKSRLCCFCVYQAYKRKGIEKEICKACTEVVFNPSIAKSERLHIDTGKHYVYTTTAQYATDRNGDTSIHMCGTNNEGQSIQLIVDGFEPYFYVKKPEQWSSNDVEEFYHRLAGKLRSSIWGSIEYYYKKQVSTLRSRYKEKEEEHYRLLELYAPIRQHYENLLQKKKDIISRFFYGMTMIPKGHKSSRQKKAEQRCILIDIELEKILEKLENEDDKRGKMIEEMESIKGQLESFNRLIAMYEPLVKSNYIKKNLNRDYILSNGKLLLGYSIERGRDLGPWKGEDSERDSDFIKIKVRMPQLVRKCRNFLEKRKFRNNKKVALYEARKKKKDKAKGMKTLDHFFTIKGGKDKESDHRNARNKANGEENGNENETSNKEKKKVNEHLHWLREELHPEGKEFGVFEANLPYIYRYMIDVDKPPCAWLEIPSSSIQSSYTSSTEWTYRVHYTKVESAPQRFQNLSPPQWILSYDIECETKEDGGFPTPDVDPVLMFSAALARSDKPHDVRYVSFMLDSCYSDVPHEKRKNANVISREVYCFPRDKESEMLSAIGEFISIVDPDILTFYNGYNFDNPYLWKRALHLGVEEFKYLSRDTDFPCYLRETNFYSKARGNKQGFFLQIMGRMQYDMLPIIVNNPFFRLRSYTLNDVTTAFLGGQKKVEYSTNRIRDIYKTTQGRTETLIYCEVDALLPLQLLVKLSEVTKMIQTSRVTYVDPQALMDRGQQLRSQLAIFRTAKYWKPYRFFVPTQDVDPSKHITYSGAKVFEPQRGWYKNPVFVLDVNSLYPHVMIYENLCYTTRVDKDHVEEALRKGIIDDSDDYEDRSKCFKYQFTTKDGKHDEKVYFLKKEYRMSVLADIEYRFLAERKRVKGLLKNAFTGKKWVSSLCVTSDLTVPQEKPYWWFSVPKEFAKAYEGGTLTKEIYENAVDAINKGKEEGVIQADDAEKALTFIKKSIEEWDGKKHKAPTETAPWYFDMTEEFKEALSNEDRSKLLELQKDEVAHFEMLAQVRNAWQNAIKMVCNSLYGYTGADGGGMRAEPRVAAAVTTGGRRVVDRMQQGVDKQFWGKVKCIYGDTDSIFVKVIRTVTKDNNGCAECRKKQHRLKDLQPEEFIECFSCWEKMFKTEIFDKETGEMKSVFDKNKAIKNAFEIGMKAEEYVNKTIFQGITYTVELEKVYYPLLLVGKKGYASSKYEPVFENGEIKVKNPEDLNVMGMDVKRKDNSRVNVNIQSECMLHLFRDGNVEAAIQACIEGIRDINQNRYDTWQYIITTKVSKPESAYANKKKGGNLPAAVQVALDNRKRSGNTDSIAGEVVQYVVCCIPGEDTVSKKSRDPLYAIQAGIPIDRRHYLKVLRKKLEIIFNQIDPKIVGRIFSYTSVGALVEERITNGMLAKYSLGRQKKCVKCKRVSSAIGYIMCAECLLNEDAPSELIKSRDEMIDIESGLMKNRCSLQRECSACRGWNSVIDNGCEQRNCEIYWKHLHNNKLLTEFYEDWEKISNTKRYLMSKKRSYMGQISEALNEIEYENEPTSVPRKKNRDSLLREIS